MSKQANPTMIGAFMLGGIALLVLGVMLFGGAELFARESRMVAYFPGSVQGLRVGSNVLLRGVRVGFVEDIQLLGDVDTLETRVQVTMRVFPELLSLTRAGRVIEDRDSIELDDEQLIEAGLKAQLGVESYVTGQLLVDLDFLPDKEVVFRGQNPPYPEMPTIPNNIDRIVAEVRRFMVDLEQTVDVTQLAADLQIAVHGIAELANSQDLRNALAGFDTFINADDTQQLTSALSRAVVDARETLESTRKLMDETRAGLDPVLQELGPAFARLEATLNAAQTTLEQANASLRGDSALSGQLVATMAEVESVARSLRVFVDYIERHPEALLRGKREL